MNEFLELTATMLNFCSEIDSGLIPTLNKMGYMTTFLDPYSEKFIQYSANCRQPVLEIGSAYGIATLKALDNGATVVSNDLDPRHLQILKSKCPKEAHGRLTLVAGKFPEVTLSSNYFDAILTVRVLHFLDGKTLRNFLSRCYDLLTINGKLFVVVDTPYLKDWQNFIKVFEQRVKNNSEWPGLIKNTRLFNSKRIPQLPKLMHWIDINILQRELKIAGFNIERIEYLNRIDYPIDSRLDGRESVGAIAVKL
jgi:SAM-dependent methyltransferase